MNAYPAPNHLNSHHRAAIDRAGNAISFIAAMQALRAAQKDVPQDPVPPPPPVEKLSAPSTSAVNFSLRVGVEAEENALVHIRALVTSLDSGFKVMSFPAQHESFLWELNLPAGNYRLEVKGNNALGGITTADIDGALACPSGHDSSNDESYVMSMNFVIV